MNTDRGSNQSGTNAIAGSNGAQGSQTMQHFSEEDFDAVQESRDIRVNVAAGNISETDMEVCRSSSSNSLASESSSTNGSENERVKFKITISTPTGVSNGSVNHNHLGPNGHHKLTRNTIWLQIACHGCLGAFLRGENVIC